ncbi:MAG: CRISPR-associated protein Cas4 [Terriglobia bacterium]
MAVDLTMYTEEDLLPISALQHLSFCERQWALIHLEGLWAENRLTVEGHYLHDRTHKPETESRGDVRIGRALRLRSLRLGLTGIADVVEFRRATNPPEPPAIGSDATPPGVRLPGVAGVWQPFPVEYKRGKPKLGPFDEIQLCAQALCLEEMLGAPISSAAIFYGQPRERLEVPLTPALREQTERLAARLHELTQAGKTPVARYEKKCESCSLLTLCMPKTTGAGKSVDHYLAAVIDT